jgi:hypothetical protein
MQRKQTDYLLDPLSLVSQAKKKPTKNTKKKKTKKLKTTSRKRRRTERRYSKPSKPKEKNLYDDNFDRISIWNISPYGDISTSNVTDPARVEQFTDLFNNAFAIPSTLAQQPQQQNAVAKSVYDMINAVTSTDNISAQIQQQNALQQIQSGVVNQMDEVNRLNEELEKRRIQIDQLNNYIASRMISTSYSLSNPQLYNFITSDLDRIKILEEEIVNKQQSINDLTKQISSMNIPSGMTNVDVSAFQQIIDKQKIDIDTLQKEINNLRNQVPGAPPPPATQPSTTTPSSTQPSTTTPPQPPQPVNPNAPPPPPPPKILTKAQAAAANLTPAQIAQQKRQIAIDNKRAVLEKGLRDKEKELAEAKKIFEDMNDPTSGIFVSHADYDKAEDNYNKAEKDVAYAQNLLDEFNKDPDAYFNKVANQQAKLAKITNAPPPGVSAQQPGATPLTSKQIMAMAISGKKSEGRKFLEILQSEYPNLTIDPKTVDELDKATNMYVLKDQPMIAKEVEKLLGSKKVAEDKKKDISNELIKTYGELRSLLTPDLYITSNTKPLTINFPVSRSNIDKLIVGDDLKRSLITKNDPRIVKIIDLKKKLSLLKKEYGDQESHLNNIEKAIEIGLHSGSGKKSRNKHKGGYRFSYINLDNPLETFAMRLRELDFHEKDIRKIIKYIEDGYNVTIAGKVVYVLGA